MQCLGLGLGGGGGGWGTHSHKWDRVACHTRGQKHCYGSFCGTFQDIETEKYDRRCVVLVLVSLRGGKTFPATPTKQDLGTS